jgi:hypothetical protein
MEEKQIIGFLEESPGVKSNSRLIGDIVILAAILMAAYLVIVGIYQGESIMIIATSAGTLFTTIAGPAMFFIFKQKQTEDKRELEKENS